MMVVRKGPASAPQVPGQPPQVHLVGVLSPHESEGYGYGANALHQLGPGVVSAFEVGVLRTSHRRRPLLVSSRGCCCHFVLRGAVSGANPILQILCLAPQAGPETHGHYYWALRLATAPCPPALLRLTPRTPEERAAARQLPSLMSTKVGDEEGPDSPTAAQGQQQPKRLTLQPTQPPDASGAVVLEARICAKSVVSAWIHVFKDKRLWLALDIDDTVLKAFRLQDFELALDAIHNDRDAAEAAFFAAKKARLRWRRRPLLLRGSLLRVRRERPCGLPAVFLR